MSVSVCVCSIPPRGEFLAEALASVAKQTRPVDEICVAVDHEHKGGAATRNRALHMATSDWVAFLDDDDLFKPQHIERLLAHQEDTGADVVYPWYDYTPIGGDPFPQFEGKPWDDNDRHLFPITTLVRRQLALDVGGFVAEFPDGPMAGEDWPFWNSIGDAGGVISHLNERTWTWRFHGGNTSGVASQW